MSSNVLLPDISALGRLSGKKKKKKEKSEVLPCDVINKSGHG